MIPYDEQANPVPDDVAAEPEPDDLADEFDELDPLHLIGLIYD